MTLVVALLSIFCWLGLSARQWDRETQLRLLTLIALVVALDFVRGIL